MPSLVRGKGGDAAVPFVVTTPEGGSERRLIPAVAAILPAVPSAADGTDAVSVTAGSGNQANAVATATIPAVAGKTAYISGFDIDGTGATAAAVVAPTMTGVISGTKTYALAVAAGATVQNPSLSKRFSPPIPASAVNTAISVSCPALGAGSTNNTVNVYGFYL